MTRLLINEGIQQKAEEDLLKLMIGENLQSEIQRFEELVSEVNKLLKT